MQLSRRKFLVTAAAVGTAGGLGAFISNGDEAPSHVWRGAALGGEARIALYATDKDMAAKALSAVAGEIERLENIFSLHREESELSRLNSAGRLSGVSSDFVEVLEAAEVWRTKTGGAFNPLVQSMWQAAAKGQDATPQMLRSAQGDINVADEIVLPAGTHATLNGIAQGHIADRITELLRSHGFDNVVIDAGELRIPGSNRRAVGIPALKSAISVAEVAIATSEPKALVFDAKTFRHHLIDPGVRQEPEVLGKHFRSGAYGHDSGCAVHGLCGHASRGRWLISCCRFQMSRSLGPMPGAG